MKSITHQSAQPEELSLLIQTFYSSFQLNKIAKKANFTKLKGFSFELLFCFLISTIFSCQSTFRHYLKNQESLAFSDKTFRNLMNDGRINWQSFLLQVSQKVAAYFGTLTNDSRKNVFIIDDSMYERPNGKKVELSALQFDHAKHRWTRGFRFLTLGWSDGNSVLPVSFSLLSGKKNQVKPSTYDQRSNSGKRKAQALRKGTEVAIELLASALKTGHQADYVLFDSWFFSPKMFRNIRQLELHSIAIVKRSCKFYYEFNGKKMDVKEIFRSEKKRRGRSRYLLSVMASAVFEDGEKLPIKLVYVRNRSNRKDYLVLASTDVTLDEDEIIRLYGKRWSIEVYFKMCKQYLHLSKYQGIIYDGIFAHTVLVAISYMLLSLRQREEVDDRTIGELFYLTVDELADLTFVEAIRLLITLFQESFSSELILDAIVLDNILEQFMNQLPKSVQKQITSTV
ncbi:transposase [Enterococcus hulanensis]|uniref:IS4 family transposase n=1 Tax=Enterococcus hulanensis TaxID=2559929 RepID=UPI0028927276|nr:transposase [Enterococcus hulanensis]MDT2661123.1 transposase [Enterococcus hulanensis]